MTLQPSFATGNQPYDHHRCGSLIGRTRTATDTELKALRLQAESVNAWVCCFCCCCSSAICCGVNCSHAFEQTLLEDTDLEKMKQVQPKLWLQFTSQQIALGDQFAEH